MKVDEFVKRARTSRLSKKAKFDAAFERARRELRLIDAGALAASPPITSFPQRRKPDEQ